MNNLSLTRQHLEMLRDEIQGHLPVVVEYQNGHREPAGQWSGFVRQLLRSPGDRPLWDRRPILLIHDATRQPRTGWPQALIITLGEEAEA